MTKALAVTGFRYRPMKTPEELIKARGITTYHPSKKLRIRKGDSKRATTKE